MKTVPTFVFLWSILGLTMAGAGDELKRINEMSREIDGRVRQARESGNLLTELQALEALEAEYSKDEFAHRVLRLKKILLLPQAGEYAETHRQGDLMNDLKQPAPDPAKLAAAFAVLAPVPAVQALAEAAAGRQVVMINEAHHVPQHRAFTLQLLYALREKGFQYFAAEALSQDPRLAERGYPTRATGTYTSEPVFGDLVRTALCLGYKVVPYESEAFASGQDPQIRENDQARHLVERILQKDPAARVVVHAGFGHISEQPSPEGIPKMMAVVFKEMTGVDPLTINQYWMTEHSSPEYEDPVYRWAADLGLIGEPVVFRTAKGKIWTRSGFDVALFHPRSRYENGRPHWLRMGGLRSPYPLLAGICGQAPRCLVKARPVKEGEDAIPIDQILVETGKPVPALMLPAGEFVIRVEDAKGKVILEFPAALDPAK